MSDPRFSLLVLSGDDNGRVHPLPQGPTVVGRVPSCDLQLRDEAVSRRHARFVLTGDVLTVEDLNSNNGTCVDEEPVRGVRTLDEGDVIRLATSLVKVVRNQPSRAIATSVSTPLPSTDPMTGLRNRGHFKAELERALAAGTQLSLVMVDIDFLQRVNHNVGHHVADEVIKHVAAILDELVPDDQVVARYGGEEFAVLLPNVQLDAALTFASRVCDVIAARPFTHNGGSLKLTVSAGAAFIAGRDALEGVRAAEMAMLRAKSAGRNRASV